MPPLLVRLGASDTHSASKEGSVLAPNTSPANEQPEGEKLLLGPSQRETAGRALSASPQVPEHPSPGTPNR